MKTFTITYTIYFNNGRNENKKMKVKNCTSELHAKTKLGNYLKSKHTNFDKLIISECEIDNIDYLRNIFKI